MLFVPPVAPSSSVSASLVGLGRDTVGAAVSTLLAEFSKSFLFSCDPKLVCDKEVATLLTPASASNDEGGLARPGICDEGGLMRPLTGDEFCFLLSTSL